jgi:hypothetical protein
MQSLNPHKAGLAVGAVLGGWHFLWSLLVAAGWAQPFIDFIFWIHFIKPIHVIETFAVGRALLLILVTAAIGYAIGATFGVLWNRIHR